MPVITEIADLKPLFRARVPRMFHDYVEAGSWTGQTFRENSSDFQQLYFRQRVAVDMAERSLASTMIGQPVAMPVALSPVGLLGMQHPDGEIHAALAAKAFGVPFTQSTMSMCSIEDVSAALNAPFWFQLYTLRDQEFLENILHRARVAGVSALVLTLDLQMQGQRHPDLKNGMTAPPRLSLRNLMNIATKPRWALGMMGTKRRFFGNIIGHARGVEHMGDLLDWTSRQFDQSLDWARVAWIRDLWGGPIILKGINDVEDARRAADLGVDAIIVSNHGGRQLDGALSTIRMLPSIVAAVGDQVEVHLDGGIRSGQDALKALSLGAKATYVGRAYTYGLGAMGAAGVTRALEIIAKEMDLTMGFCGERDVRAMSRDNLLVPKGFSGRWE
ncbi:alpha-hydroxy acid oxidase [Pseudoruegeria sp. SK021]|uniref:alpha-hydroxy acid oxidase n=1 Tax=Pseudoruegeria sp. SK021 TaxID=1933035 RepID=UPI000A24663D|nr:alpha-hydroxy acid oxidase [Pseudoruegeria sp. SK021]OSP55397.1 alpha-hydroxy-acid oxidizing enzyme [Pseudoruegeria sp. SK021]